MKESTFFREGLEITVCEPDFRAPGSPWVWRCEFLHAFDSADRALLSLGWHICYCRLSDQFGCPAAISEMKRFRDLIVAEYRLSPKADLFGFSRGGLYAFHYAVSYPDDVSVLYLDAPVLDIRSWPGGLGAGAGNPREWANCMRLYGLTEETAPAFRGNPVDRLDALLATGIPVILVAGDSDTTVPYSENGKLLADYFAENGGTCSVIVKPGVGHHPHSLEDPTEIVGFIRRYRH